MDKFKSIIKRICNKNKLFNKDIYKKESYIEPILIISGSLLVAFTIIVTTKVALTKGDISIEDNWAEVAFYNGRYEEAIDEYKILQKYEKWPIWEVKIAEIESMKGKIKESNDLLKNAVFKRNKLLAKKNGEKYKDKDSYFVNSVAFTYFMNGEYDTAIALGEEYIDKNGKDKDLMKTMYASYIVAGEKEKAKRILNIYDLDMESAYDLAVVAEMNMLIGNWNYGFELLEEAWNKDKNEIKVLDVISQFATYNRREILSKLTALIDRKSNKVVCKIWLAKVYSMRPETYNIAEHLIEEVKDENVGDIPLNIIKEAIYEDEYVENEESKKVELENITNNNESSYIDYYIAGWKNIKNGDYDKAFENCKKSILKNRDYPDNYVVLTPEVMKAKKKEKISESYLITGLKKEPFNYNTMIKIADYYALNSTDSKNASKYYNLALALKSSISEVNYRLGVLDLLDEKIDSSLKYLDEAVTMDDEVAKYHRALGTAYLTKGEYNKAIKSIERAYEIDKNDVLTLNNIGCYYIVVENNIEKGMDYIKRAYDSINSTDYGASVKIVYNYNKIKNLNHKRNGSDKEKLKITDLLLYYY